MGIEIRTPTHDEWPAICRADDRISGGWETEERIEERRAVHDLSRFRIAVDGDRIVGIANSYGMEVTLPGGAIVPMGGVSWVSTATTHRRQGVMRSVLEAVHDDIDGRGEPIASLYASEGSIYEHLAYGIATRRRLTTIDPRRARFRGAYRCDPGAVRYLEGDDVVPAVSRIWDRYRRAQPGEAGRSSELQRYFAMVRGREQGGRTPVFYLAHADGYAAYRLEDTGAEGHPALTLHLVELAAVTPAAHAALWQTLLATDFVTEIRSPSVPADDPLPFLLEDQRAVATAEDTDGVWVNVRDISAAFGSRTYRTDDRIVVEVDGRRWAVDGGPSGGSCRPVRTKPDLVTTHAWFSSLLYGGMLPSSLVAGRRMTARGDEVLTRADLFFATNRPPFCQEFY